MPIRIILFLYCLSFWSCQKAEQAPLCRLTKFVTDYPATGITHYDLITLKDNRIERVVSYDVKNIKDTTARQRIVYEYNTLGKITKIRDESNLSRITFFEFLYNTGENPYKVFQKTGETILNEVILEFDEKNRPTAAVSLNLLGLNRSIEYDYKGNPFRIRRADFGNAITINEHTFDDKRNFFAGIPEIGLYWLLRPLYNFIPFGDNNIIGTKFLTVQNLAFKEVPDLRTARETIYNEQGFPLKMSIFLENQGKIVSTVSSFEYDCE